MLVFHLWPAAAPGGYVGVDVFFVISGYLMTGLLVREAEAAGRISLVRFYARRIRRLLPAASVTLVVVGLASIVLLPLLRWQDTAAEIAASAFYVENWWLRSESVDYLALEQAPSPVQHFWSLSVEEQFYIVWPLMMVSLLWLRRRTGWPLRRLLAGGLLALTAASLVHSVRATIDAPGPAYFSSATRLWELGLGGLLVLAPVVRGSRFLVWGGLAAIGAAGALYSTETSFPGHAALLPTGGTAAVILAARSGGLLAWRPLQYLGGISYSLYLWHWPLIVFHGVYQGDEIGPWTAVAIGAVSIALAHASKVLVEDPVRTAEGLQRRLWRSYAVGGALALACAATAAGLHFHVERIGGQSAVSAADYPGARALAGIEVAPRPIRPTLLEASREPGAAHGDASRPSCIQDSLGVDVITCEYGRPAATTTIALIGDSHAEHWLPAFQELAASRDWRVVTYLKDSCLVGDVTVQFRPLGREYAECDTWKRAVERMLLATRPDLVVVSQAQRHRVGNKPPDRSAATIARGLRATWHRLAAAGLDVAVIEHTPIQAPRVLECLSRDGASIDECSASRADALVAGAVTLAARDNPDVALIDLTDQFCPDDRCPAVIGNVLVYRDSAHLTAAYVRTVAPVLGQRLVARFPALAR